MRLVFRTSRLSNQDVIFHLTFGGSLIFGSLTLFAWLIGVSPKEDFLTIAILTFYMAVLNVWFIEAWEDLKAFLKKMKKRNEA